MAEGLDADEVSTFITRIENPDGPGTVYTFEKGSVIGGASDDDDSWDAPAFTDKENLAIAAMRAKVTQRGEAIDIDKAATVLAGMASYGISKARAAEIAEAIAVDGMISA